MSITERDVILRAIKQKDDTLARISALRRSGKAELALQEFTNATGSILGPLLATVETFDPCSTVMLLSEPDKVRAHGLLVAERSAIHCTLGNQRLAQVDWLHTVKILSHRMRGSDAIDDDVCTALEDLCVA